MIRRLFDIKILLVLAISILPVIAQAVTQKEMEQARTIAAKSYLRYANDGSGYLDDLNPKTMEELEAALKTKEKENIKAFKAIPVPSDYQSWNKDKLVEYWAVTAFQTKGLLEKGKGGRIRARSLINKMNVSAPQANPAPAAAATSQTTATPAPNATNVNPVAADSTLMDSLKADEKTVLADEEALEADANAPKESNYTWAYILALAILVAVVIALVVYAANVFKKTGGNSQTREPYRDDDDQEEMKEHYDSVIADKNVEISMLNKKLEAANRQNAELKTKLETLAAEIAALQPVINKNPIKENEPRVAAPQTQGNAPLRSIFLGRANSKGIFVRADRTLNMGHSVFVLDTSDGFSGSFRVADSPAAWSLALSNPREYLETACTGHDLNDTSDASRIVTEASGTAVFEGGCWRVIRKAKIRYEV